MTAFTDFLAANYFWFLVISIILLFALIGYFVDQNEQKKGISKIIKAPEPEVNISDLAAMAQNKSLNHAVSDAARQNNPYATAVNFNSNVQGNGTSISNTISNQSAVASQNNIIQESNQTSQGETSNTIGFDVLSK